MENKEFKKEKIVTQITIPAEMLSDVTIDVDTSVEDFVKNTLTARMQGFIYSRLAEERELTYFFDRPTFLDWLLRRKRVAKFKLKVNEVLTDPPTLGTVRMYEDKAI